MRHRRGRLFHPGRSPSAPTDRHAPRSAGGHRAASGSPRDRRRPRPRARAAGDLSLRRSDFHRASAQSREFVPTCRDAVRLAPRRRAHGGSLAIVTDASSSTSPMSGPRSGIRPRVVCRTVTVTESAVVLVVVSIGDNPVAASAADAAAADGAPATAAARAPSRQAFERQLVADDDSDLDDAQHQHHRRMDRELDGGLTPITDRAVHTRSVTDWITRSNSPLIAAAPPPAVSPRR